MTSAVLEHYKNCGSKKKKYQFTDFFIKLCFNILEICSASVCVSVFQYFILLNKHILEQNHMNRNVQAPCSNTSVVCLVQIKSSPFRE